MKILLYDNDFVVLSSIENIKNPITEDNNVFWQHTDGTTGSLKEINCNFEVVEDDFDQTKLSSTSFLSVNLAKEQQKKIDELSMVCEQKISEGFFCESTGYFYRLNSKDQDNFSYRLNTILLAGKENYKKPIYWRTGKDGDGVYILHTVDQFISVIDAADDHTTYHSMRYSQLKEKVKTYTSIQDVQTITWDTQL
jgi:hypothetical protein